MKTLMLSAAGTLVLATGLAAAPSAMAATSIFNDIQQPAGACQPAREYPDVRVRQIEIDNIGTTNAYIVCAPVVHYQGGQATRIFLAFQNAGEVSRTIKCTLHNQYMGGGDLLYATVREVVIAAGNTDSIDFELADEDISNLYFPGIQCILPAQTSVGYLFIEYTENDLTGV